MIVTVNRETLVFCHAHPTNQELLSRLADIELGHVSCYIFDADLQEAWGMFNTDELKSLYKNTCGRDAPPVGRATLHSILTAMATALSPCKANAFDVRLQAARIGETDARPYRYVPGAQAPELKAEDWVPPALQADAPSGIPSTQSPQAGAGPDRPAAATTTPASAPKARSGGNTEKIFSVADAMWAAAGKPTNLTVVLQLRKQMMDELEAKHDVKRTTSSTTLGAWQKARLNP